MDYFCSTFFGIFAAMDVKDYLLSNKTINRADIARLMYPKNSDADTYLYKKLNNKDNRRFTRKDALLAQEALKQIGHNLINLTVAERYE